jgi:hypothetical protein
MEAHGWYWRGTLRTNQFPEFGAHFVTVRRMEG